MLNNSFFSFYFYFFIIFSGKKVNKKENKSLPKHLDKENKINIRNNVQVNLIEKDKNKDIDI